MKALSLKTATTVTLVLISILFLTVVVCTAKQPTPPEPTTGQATIFAEGVPGGIVVDTTTITAKVKSIDQAERKVTLVGPEGDESTVTIGPEAINFDQVKKGDLVKVTLTKELVVFLGGQDSAKTDGAAAVVAQAPKGAQPGGAVAGTFQLTGTVKEIDEVKRTATLQFEDGHTETFPVRDDIDLSQQKIGQKVVFRVTKMVAIAVEKP